MLIKQVNVNYFPIIDSPVEHIIDWFIIIGLLAGAITMMQFGLLLGSNSLHGINISFPASYKIVKVVEILCIITAGTLSYFTNARRFVPKAVQGGMWFLFLWMFGHAVITYWSGFSPSEPIGEKGPIVWWSLLVIFAGISEKRWTKLIPVIQIIVLAGSIDILFTIWKMGGVVSRDIAVNTLRMPLNLLFWTAPLVFLLPSSNYFTKLNGMLALSLMGIVSILTATRSWIIIFTLYLGIFLYGFFKKISGPVKRGLAAYTIFLIVIITSLIYYNLFEAKFSHSIGMLSQRFSEDTRTSQLALFFERVPISDFILGAGPRGTWRWGSGARSSYGHVDGAYFLMLFIGGIPLLINYFSLVVYPSVLALKRMKLTLPEPVDKACIILACVWALSLTGFSTYNFPALQTSHYVVLLCVGRCWHGLHPKLMT